MSIILSRDALREIEIAEVGGDFVSVEAGDGGEGVVVEQAGNLAPLGGRVGICNYMQQALLRMPRFGENAIQRTQREMFRAIKLQDLRRLQIRRDAKRVPTHVDRLVDVGRRPLEPRRIHFLFRRLQQRRHPFHGQAQPLGDFFNRSSHIQDIFRRIVVHLADFVDVVVQTRDRGFLFSQDSLASPPASR